MAIVNRPGTAVFIGGSAGSIEVLETIVKGLPASFPWPIVVVVHLAAARESLLPKIFGQYSKLAVKEAEGGERMVGGTLYFAPPNYHLLAEADGTFALSVEAPVQYSRPSIDVLFESAADAYGASTLGILLSGANTDGSRGMARIRAAGGRAVVQDPGTALMPTMPAAGVEFASPGGVLSPERIQRFILDFARADSGG